MARAIPVKVSVVPKERAALHRLLDEILDRRPDLEEHLQLRLRQMVEAAADPRVVTAMTLLSAGKQAIDAVGGFRPRKVEPPA